MNKNVLFSDLEILEQKMASTKCSNNDVWTHIINSQDVIFLSGYDESQIANNRLLQNLHRCGKRFYQTPFDITEKLQVLHAISCPTILCDISPEEAEKIRSEYGVCCYASNDDSTPFLVKQGWTIETSDPENESNWEWFYEGSDRTCNSALIVDRYLFQNEWNKDNKLPDDNLDDSINNLRSIVDGILPETLNHGDFVLTIVCENSKVFTGKAGHFVPIQKLVKRIESIKNYIHRSFKYDIEVFLVERGRPFYSETHDRFVITNYTVTEASHKLKAYRSPNISLCNQKISFSYIFCKPHQKSSMSSVTQKRVLEAIHKIVTDEDGKIEGKIIYALNGEIIDNNEWNSKNRLINPEI